MHDGRRHGDGLLRRQRLLLLQEEGGADGGGVGGEDLLLLHLLILPLIPPLMRPRIILRPVFARSRRAAILILSALSLIHI